jgi:hypothetical protein
LTASRGAAARSWRAAFSTACRPASALPDRRRHHFSCPDNRDDELGSLVLQRVPVVPFTRLC